MNGKRIAIQSICLEEDAARKVETKAGEVTYRLDRLGIPLIEIATGPDMHTPEEVREVAARLGSMLRATKKVKRGLGTIREDLNISIPGGARVEIKGVQELRLLPIVRGEGDRAAARCYRSRTTGPKHAASEAPRTLPSAALQVQGDPSALQGWQGRRRRAARFEGIMQSRWTPAPGSGDGPVRPYARRGRHIPFGRAAGVRHNREGGGSGSAPASSEGAFALCADDPEGGAGAAWRCNAPERP